MSATYSYNRSLHKHHLARLFLVMVAIAALIGLGWLLWRHYTGSPIAVNGQTLYVPQSAKAQPTQIISEPLFVTQLPSDWRLVSAKSGVYSWQSTLKGNDNRYLSIYVDSVPTSLPVNQELPLTVNGNQLSYGALSGNCANFTPGGTLNAAQAVKLKPSPAVWHGVNFICNLPRVIDNQIGTGSVGNPVNATTITGPQNGTHSYFFLYTDRNAQPDYSILYNVIQNFRAK